MEPCQNNTQNPSSPTKIEQKLNNEYLQSKSGPHKDREETKEGFPPTFQDLGDKIKPFDLGSPSDPPISQVILKKFRPLFENQSPPTSLKEFLKRVGEDKRICKGLTLSERDLEKIFQYLEQQGSCKLQGPSKFKEEEKLPSFVFHYIEHEELYEFYDQENFNEPYKSDYMYFSYDFSLLTHLKEECKTSKSFSEP